MIEKGLLTKLFSRHVEIALNNNEIEDKNIPSKYQALYEWAKAQFTRIELAKRQVIKELAERLEAAGMPVELIAAEIAHNLEGYVSEQYVRRSLDKKYKQEEKAREKLENIAKPVSQIAVTNVTEELETIEPEESDEEKQIQEVSNSPPKVVQIERSKEEDVFEYLAGIADGERKFYFENISEVMAKTQLSFRKTIKKFYFEI
jgi:hypothetical protein